MVEYIYINDLRNIKYIQTVEPVLLSEMSIV
jgi:hypothetical protein